MGTGTFSTGVQDPFGGRGTNLTVEQMFGSVVGGERAVQGHGEQANSGYERDECDEGCRGLHSVSGDAEEESGDEVEHFFSQSLR